MADGALETVPPPAVRDCIAFYNDLFAGRLGDSARAIMADAVERHDLLFKASHAARVLRPLIVDEGTYRQVSEAVRLLARAVTAAADRLAMDRSLRRDIGMPEYLDPLIETDASSGGHSIMSRFDGLLADDGTFQMMEFNSAPGGTHVGMELTWAFERMPIARAFARRYPYRYPNVVDLAFGACRRDHRGHGGQGTPTIGVVAINDDFPPHAELRWLAYAAARGCRTLMAPPEAFEHTKGQLTVRGARVDLVMFANWNAIVSSPEKTAGIVAAVGAGHARVIHGLSRGLLCGYKNTLELLSNPAYRHLFDAAVSHALDSNVPWTRVLRPCTTTAPGGERIDLLEYVSAHRQQLVVKPSGGREGRGVLLGWQTGPEEWDRVLGRAQGNYVVQQRVAARPQTYPVEQAAALHWRDLIADCGPYVWNARTAAGWLARVSTGGLHNISGGAIVTGVWIVRNGRSRC